VKYEPYCGEYSDSDGGWIVSIAIGGGETINFPVTIAAIKEGVVADSVSALVLDMLAESSRVESK
jgi:hypothetical protein